MNQNMYYVVFIGRVCGIYDHETDAISQIQGFEDGFYEPYSDYETADEAIKKFLNIDSTPDAFIQ